MEGPAWLGCVCVACMCMHTHTHTHRHTQRKLLSVCCVSLSAVCCRGVLPRGGWCTAPAPPHLPSPPMQLVTQCPPPSIALSFHSYYTSFSLSLHLSVCVASVWYFISKTLRQHGEILSYCKIVLFAFAYLWMHDTSNFVRSF